MVMKYIKIVFWVFVCLFICNQVAAKEDRYGNIKLRSIGVGKIHKSSIQPRFVTPNYVKNGEHYVSYGRSSSEVANLVVAYQQPTAIKSYGFTAYDKTPFIEGTVVTMYPMYSSGFGGGEDPNHPGVPVGDAWLFVVFLVVGYVCLRNKG